MRTRGELASRRCLPVVFFLLFFSGALLPPLANAQGEIRLSYLGTAGWELEDAKTVILVDPYLSRLKLPTPNDAVLADDARPLYGWDSLASSDQPVIDAHIRKADFILVTHTHPDHVLDVPYIARKTGAMVLGTQSTINLARASGVPDSHHGLDGSYASSERAAGSSSVWTSTFTFACGAAACGGTRSRARSYPSGREQSGAVSSWLHETRR